jgi:hypothetical protein
MPNARQSAISVPNSGEPRGAPTLKAVVLRVIAYGPVATAKKILGVARPHPTIPHDLGATKGFWAPIPVSTHQLRVNTNRQNGAFLINKENVCSQQTCCDLVRPNAINARFSENPRLEKLHRLHWEIEVFDQALIGIKNAINDFNSQA